MKVLVDAKFVLRILTDEQKTIPVPVQLRNQKTFNERSNSSLTKKKRVEKF